LALQETITPARHDGHWATNKFRRHCWQLVAGAASVIGTAAIAKAAPDGYTLVMSDATALAVAVTVYKKLPYDPTKDFAPIALVSRIPFVLVAHPSLPVRYRLFNRRS
jgi:tripartite-type tricarboxylate transporter receptor subunit TctC